jgi:hypothetical protein
MLHHIRASGDTSQVHGYLIHSLRFWDSETTSTFWQLQSAIVAQLWTLQNLQMIVAVIIPNHNGRCVKSFHRQLKSTGWCISQFDDVFFPNLRDTIAGRCNILIGIHSSCAPHVEPLELKPPPPVSPHPLGTFLWEPFNRLEHPVSLMRNDDDFCRQDIKFHVTDPPTEIRFEPGVTVRYFLHCFGTDKSTLCGSFVVSSDGLCHPFDVGANQNLFQHLFEIEFHFKNHTYVRGLSPFKFAQCFGFHDNLTYCLSHPLCKFALDAAVPSMTSAWVFD